MSYSNVGKVWTAEEFEQYLGKLGKLGWAKSVTIHHTGTPNLAMRPKGWTRQHMKNLRSFYKNTKKWSRGPHLFTDEDQIFGLSPLTERGIHAVSFNKNSIGIEALGNYDKDSPRSGRGRAVMEITAISAKLLLEKLNLPVNSNTIKFHRDDRKTKKSCPGKKVAKEWFLDLVKSATVEPSPIPKSGIPKKPVIKGWSQFTYAGGQWNVPVIAFLDHIGGAKKALASKLKSKDGMFFYDGDLIEGAFYDKDKQATWAPAEELREMI